ncbi:EAL domain-containing protein [Synechocystis sp. LKSZ1]|uniref:EAL domain-containing protein n=1 Tax=Synechocystis sp. LKSZ1 TaxID=3144951 RepID=UPI00336BFA25
MTNTPTVRHILVIEDQKSRRIVTLEENTYDIGRDPSSAIILYDRQVSRHHATLLRINDYQNQHYTYRIIDGNLQGKRSTNGVMVNGQYCLSHELKNGDQITFGSKSRVNYQIVEVDAESSGAPSDSLSPAPALFSPSPLAQRPEQFDREDFDPEVPLSEEAVFSTAILFASEIEEALAEQKQPTQQDNRLFTLAELSPQAIVEITQEGHLLYANPATHRFFPDLQTLQENHPFFAGLFQLTPGISGLALERELNYGGQAFSQQVYVFPEKHLIRCYCGEITAQRRLENNYVELQQRHHLYRQLTTDGFVIVDAHSKQVLEANPTYQHLLGYNETEILDLNLYQLMGTSPEQLDPILRPLQSQDMILLEESQHQRRDGSFIRVGAKIHRQTWGDHLVYCFIVRDLREQQAIEDQLQHQRLADPVTLLPNRLYLEQQLEKRLQPSPEKSLGVLFIHLNAFARLSQSYGYRLGDELLKAVGQALQQGLAGEQTMGYWGDATFGILLPQLKQVEDLSTFAERLLERFRQPVTVAGQDFLLSSTIGIAVYPDDGTTVPELFNHADIALHQLRQEGHNQYQFYNTRFSTEARFQIRLEQLLEQAIAKKQFHLRYQPQLDLQTGAVTGLEAFLRWEHPEVGDIAPNKIIPLAAQSNLIFEISDWVLRQACQHNLAWQKDRLPPVPVSVNLCRQEFYRQELATVVAKILNQTGLDPRWLELEITEAVLRHDPPSAKKTLRDLRNLGVRIALDDFGTGASSLGFITQFDLQTVKLDQQLIRNMRGLPQEKALIAAIVALGKGFQCRVIAEGLEGETQLQLLQQLHCPEAQGYWFSPPLKAKDVTLFLQQRLRA